jgi:glucosamine--fructose-6-phosphate aminotransferase (isomerizing)
MNLNDSKYKGLALVREMLETPGIVKRFDPDKVNEVASIIARSGKLLFTGEGSSRIFPAKNAIRKARTLGIPVQIITEGSRQASRYDLSDFSVFCASNSGKTKEVINLVKQLADRGNKNVFGLSACTSTVLEKYTAKTFVLSCGWENAVAATKSVVEQALFYDSIIDRIAGRDTKTDPSKLAEAIEHVLTLPIDAEIIGKAAAAQTIYYAGYNDGVAEELTLKTNEIARLKSDFLEGTYAVHGIEEVMHKSDIVFIIDPIKDEEDKFEEVLVKGVGLTVVAIANRPTRFPTIIVPDSGDMTGFVYLCTGWNLLTEIGLFRNIDLDKPVRARKVGNEGII